jgi:hypothetical protein
VSVLLPSVLLLQEHTTRHAADIIPGPAMDSASALRRRCDFNALKRLFFEAGSVQLEKRITRFGSDQAKRPELSVPRDRKCQRRFKSPQMCRSKIPQLQGVISR